MSASGQLPGTFTIEALPVGIDFQVIQFTHLLVGAQWLNGRVLDSRLRV